MSKNFFTGRKRTFRSTLSFINTNLRFVWYLLTKIRFTLETMNIINGKEDIFFDTPHKIPPKITTPPKVIKLKIRKR